MEKLEKLLRLEEIIKELSSLEMKSTRNVEKCNNLLKNGKADLNITRKFINAQISISERQNELLEEIRSIEEISTERINIELDKTIFRNNDLIRTGKIVLQKLEEVEKTKEAVILSVLMAIIN